MTGLMKSATAWVLAPGLLILGLALIYAGWRRSHRVLSLAGWSLMACAIPALAYRWGWEFAVVYALGLPALLVWSCIAVEASVLPDKPARAKPSSPVNWQGKLALRHALHGVVVLVAGLLLSVVATASVMQLLPLSPSASVAAAVLFLPTLWALFAWGYLATQYKGRAVLTSLLLVVVTGAMAHL